MSVRVYNQNLNPALWDTAMHLDPRIRLNLLQLAHDFYKKTKFRAPIKDIYLMGSSANFNWTPESDIDVHLIVDLGQMQMPKETAEKLSKTVAQQWNAEHDVRIKGHKVEINIQRGGEEKPHVTGIYSLINDQWVRKPSYQPVSIDRNVIQQKYSEVKATVEKAIASGNQEYLKSVKEWLDQFRQYGLDTGGELSTENIVYKILRTKGYVKKLRDTITQSYDQQLSIPEVTQADISAHHPEPYMPQKADQSPDLEKMTLGNLKSLLAKSGRTWRYHRDRGETERAEAALQQCTIFHDEIKRRLQYINNPVMEENYGMGKPENDPKAKGRWTIDFESSSKFPK
jgi:hypothetical protein